MNKFKKALKMPILAMMAASCALSATACNVEDSGNNENHKHTYKSSWTYDNENHWHQADCGHDVKSDEAPHTDSDKDGLCDICFKDLNTSTEEPGETIIHTVTVVLNGGVIDGNKTEYSVKHGEAVILFNPTRSGYTFEGWYEDQELKKPFTRGSAINEDKTLYAKWNVNTSGGTPEIKTYTVTFNSNGGSKVSSQYIDENKTIVRPSAPVLDGKFFVNWYLDSALTQVWNFNNPVTSDMTLYAKWADPVTPALIEAKGYSESLYVTWKDNSPENAKVYYKTKEETTWKLLDSQLIRAISGTVARADIVGLKEGNYNVKILPSKGAEIEVPAPIAVAAYDRSGYAHHNYDKGIGAYNDDGTIKDNTLVIYVTDENKNNAADFAYVNGEKVDISQYIKTSSDKENYGGIGYILNNRGYASNTERENYGIQKLSFTYDAVAIRIIGTVTAEQNSDGTSTLRGLTDYNSTGNGGSVGDNGRMARTSIIPLFMVVKQMLGFSGATNILGIIFPATISVFNMFLFMQFFQGIPQDYEEAARIDGAGNLKIFFKIILPLSKPIVATVAVFCFIGVWNDYLWPLMLLVDNNDLMPIQAALTVIRADENLSQGAQMASLVITSIPIFIVYIAAQKYIVQGFGTAGLKV